MFQNLILYDLQAVFLTGTNKISPTRLKCSKLLSFWEYLVSIPNTRVHTHTHTHTEIHFFTELKEQVTQK